MRKVLLIVFLVFGIGILYHFLQPTTNYSPQQKVTAPTKTSDANYSYSLTLPDNMKQMGSTIYDVNKNKIGELAPGLLTTQDKISCSEFIKRQKTGGPDLKANETNVTFSSPITPMNESQLTLGEKVWTETVWKQYLDGPALPSGQRFWYVRQYCTDRDGTLFVINFYSEKLPADNDAIVKKVLSDFRFKQQ